MIASIGRSNLVPSGVGDDLLYDHDHWGLIDQQTSLPDDGRFIAILSRRPPSLFLSCHLSFAGFEYASFSFLQVHSVLPFDLIVSTVHPISMHAFFLFPELHGSLLQPLCTAPLGYKTECAFGVCYVHKI
jgi:hypothetical protein